LALWGTVEDDLLPGATFSLKELGVPASVLERQIHISNNLDESSLAPNKEICDFCAGARACIILPLQARGRLVGLFYLSSRHREWFTEERVEIAGEIADQLAIALDDAELHAQVQRHAAELEERVDARTAELRALVDAMAGREVRMMELKEVIRELRGQLERAGLEPLADDPLLGV
jgi:GAF domain-containing protein